MNYSCEPSSECVFCVFIQLGIPLVWIKVACDPDVSSGKSSRSALNFNLCRISITPPKHVFNSNFSSEFINDDIWLRLVTTEPNCVRVFPICFNACFFSSSTCFPRSGFSPIDINCFLMACWYNVVCSDSAEGVVASNANIWNDLFKVSGLGEFPYCLPILWVGMVEGLASKFKSSSCNGGLFLEAVSSCSLASSWFRVYFISKYLFNFRKGAFFT